DVPAMDQQLAHVADVEQPRILPGPQMLGDDAFILDRHFIARERHHPGTLGAVPPVERELLQRLIGFDAHSGAPRARLRRPTPGWTLRLPPPSVAAPESFAPSSARAWEGFPLRRSCIAVATQDTFQTVRSARSLCLRDSGGG